jgi:Spy/CpxP family protein refolding chaperone
MTRRLFVLALTSIFVVFLGGFSVGVVGHRAREPVRFRSVMVEELNLTPAQRAQIERIWSKVLENVAPPPIEEMEKAESQRQKQIDEMLSAEQRARYGQIQERFEARLQELDRGGHARFAEAEEQTKQALTSAQRARYEQLLAARKNKFVTIMRIGRAETRPGSAAH